MTANKNDMKSDPVAPSTEQPGEHFPLATVRDTGAGAMIRQSKMWWITVVCLVLAVAMAWQSMPAEGPKITIQFPEGHGLKTGDGVRYRGIDVGTVTAIQLNETLSGVEVDVTLTPGSAGLNRDGTRFWIVRPRLGLTEISGLETAVGAKFIGVSPGDPTAAVRKTFDGLAAAPPDELSANGLELILQGDNQHGVSTGAPVRWRGVEVGKVLSAGLSPDARHVNISVRIEGAYRRLVRPGSKFWVTSGFGVDVSLGGVKVNAESLTTIVRGGVSFITPGAHGDDDTVRSGHVFALQSKASDEWLNSAVAAPLVDFPLPETVLVRGKRWTKLFGIPRRKSFEQTGLLIRDGNDMRLLTGVMPTEDSDDAESQTLAEFSVQPMSGAAVAIIGVAVADCLTTMSGVMSIPISADGLTVHDSAINNKISEEPEDLVVVRSASNEGKAVSVMQPIDRSQLQRQDSCWMIIDAERDYSEWHGAPVLATERGQIVGLLIIGANGPTVAGLVDE